MSRFFSSEKIGISRKYAVRGDQFCIYIPFTAKQARFVSLFDRKLTHWNRRDLPLLIRSGSRPIIEASLLRRKAGHETLPLGGLVGTSARLGNAGTAQFGQSSGPGDPCGPRS